MKHLVIGCGSIGSRRAKILAGMGEEVFVHDLFKDRAEELGKTEGPIWVWDGEDVDGALICTPPDTHAVACLEAVNTGIVGLYVEKPLALHHVDLDDVMDAASAVPVTMGACNMRFVVERLPANYDWRVPHSQIGWDVRMGQHAKHWSPNHKPVSMALDSIHDIDLLEWLGGKIVKLAGESYMDAAYLRAIMEDGSTARISLDRLTDPPERYIEAGDIAVSHRWELWPPDMTMYEREMQHWVNALKTTTQTINPLQNAARLTAMVLDTVRGNFTSTGDLP